MKNLILFKLFIATLMFFIGSELYSQWISSSPNVYTVAYGSGTRVGIGLSTPQQSLDVNGNIKLSNSIFSASSHLSLEAASNYYVQIQPRSTTHGLLVREYNSTDYGNFEVTSSGLGIGYNTADYNLLINPSGNIGVGCDPGTTTFKIYKADIPLFELASSASRLQIGGVTFAGAFGNGSRVGDVVLRTLGGTHGMYFYMPNNNNDGSTYIAFGDDANPSWVRIFNNRTFRIDGKLYAKEINVQTNVWADYVFHSDYKLKSLNEVESFINENKRLPDMPSEQEVKENGINLAEMNALLLKKVEETMLYVIELKKQNEQLVNRIEQLEKQ